jgi:hypothetical protein
MRTIRKNGKSHFTTMTFLALTSATLMAACTSREFEEKQNSGGNDVQQASTRPAGATNSGLDVNDVSFLFGQVRNDADIDKLLPISAAGIGGTPLVPKPVFDQVVRAGMASPPGSTAGSFFQGNELYENWHIVAMRFDPCASSTNHARLTRQQLSGCRFEMRLVAQPLRKVTNNPVSYDDFTMHLIYEPTAASKVDVMTSLARELQRLKSISSVDTTGLPLGVHPTMEAEGLSGPYATELKRIILNFMGGQRLVSIAFMSSVKGAPPWTFRAFSIGGGGRTVSGAVGLPNGSNFDSGTEANIDVNRSLSVVDPRQVTQFSETCVNCHRATARLSELPSLVNNPSFFTPPNGVTGFAADQKLLTLVKWEFRNFGFFGKKPQISMRTVNESAAVADLVNRTLLNVPNPALLKPSCNKQTLTQCIFDGSAGCLSNNSTQCR